MRFFKQTRFCTICKKYVLFLLFISTSPFLVSSQITSTSAINLDGNNDYINSTVDELNTGNPVHTIEAWIYADAIPAARSWPLNLGQFNTGSHHWLLEPTGEFVVGVFAGTQVKTTLSAQEWTHVAAVYNGTTLIVYINGKEVGRNTGNFSLNNVNLHLGRPWSNERYFDGTYDEVRVWNTARTPAQIARLKDRRLAGNEAGLVAYYNFDAGIAEGNNTNLSTVPDISNHGNTATVNNLARNNTSSSNWVAGTALFTCFAAGTPCDDNNPNTYEDVEDGNCNCTGWTVGAHQICVRVSSSTDDVEQLSDGSVYMNSTDLEFMDDNNRGTQQAVGIRFEGVLIPQGVSIQSASMIFTPDESTSVTTSVTFKIEATDDAAPYVDINNNVTDRTLAIPVSGRSFPAWNAGLSNADTRHNLLGSAVDAVVQRSGWQSGQAMNFVITGSGQRIAEAYDGVPSAAPLLCIEFDYCLPNSAGIACDDGDSNTYNDVFDNNCNCVGTSFDSNCEIKSSDTEYPDSYIRINKSLDCIGGIGEGDVDITLQQYLQNDWYDHEFIGICDEGQGVIIIRENLFAPPTDDRKNSGYYDNYCFAERWTIRNTDCFDEEVILNVYVHLNTIDNLAIDDVPITDKISVANNDLTSHGIVQTGDNVSFYAGNSITLEAGFMVEGGAEFLARVITIPDCAIPLQPIPDQGKKVTNINSTLSIAPNPIATSATISYELFAASVVGMSMFNSKGNLVKRWQMQTQIAGQHAVDLDTQNLPKGLYFIYLQTDYDQVIRKMIIQ